MEMFFLLSSLSAIVAEEYGMFLKIIIIGSLSNDDCDAADNPQSKMNLQFFSEI